MKLKKSRKILYGFIALSGLIVLLQSGQPTPEAPIPAPELPVQDDMVIEGVLGIVYSDDETFTIDSTTAYVSNAETLIELQFDDDVQQYAIHNGHTVVVYGDLVDADPSRSDDAPVLDVRHIEQLEVYDTSPIVEGNERWVNIACRFGDMPDQTPQPISYFSDIMQNLIPGMDHYWRETSYNQVNIEGSNAFGWYNLPKPKSDYLRAANTNTGFGLRMLLTDCAQAAARADRVDFSQYGGINVMLNDVFGCCAWGGSMGLNIDNNLVNFRVTWLPPWAYNSLHVVAHEMGHGWGLPHSSGPYGKVYDSAWDVMSGGTRMMDVCRVGSEPFGCHQVGTIGLHLAMLGWIPPQRVLTIQPDSAVVVRMNPLTQAQSGSDMLVIAIPIAGSNAFYTAEVRTFAGYDRNLPGEAVVLHQVVPNRSSPAHVVDADNDGDPNDEGAMWLPGEVFVDGKIRIEILSRDEFGFTLRIISGK